MGKEIERKFLVKGEAWRKLDDGMLYRQGYLSITPEPAVPPIEVESGNQYGYVSVMPHSVVRVRTVGKQGYLTIKSEVTGTTRLEFEYEIPLDDANEMLDTLCHKPLIEKIRRKVEYGGLIWEVDEFLGENAGLVVAEVELTDENQAVGLPEWVGEEVTGDRRYYNAMLSRHPYSRWKK